jgi:flagellin-like protein
MQLKQLIDDDQAVSPVIGVILMVAITVILAAVIGTFVLGLGEQVQNSAPNANFQFEYSGSGPYDATITHTGGDTIDGSQIQVQYTDNNDNSVSKDWTSISSSTTIETGVSGSITSTDIGAGETVRVIWTDPGGGSTQTIGESTAPQ